MNSIKPPLHFTINASGLATPFGIQILRRDVHTEWLLLAPGFCVLNSLAGNSALGLRVYKGITLANDRDIGGPGQGPVYHEQPLLFVAQIPWSDELALYVEVISETSPLPANSRIAFTVTPFDP